MCTSSFASMLKTLAFCAALLTFSSPRSIAQAVGDQSGLPLPRFVSTRSAEVNVRSGPGSRYPILWTLIYKGMPVQIIAEYENWRKIRDWLGTEGWVNQALVSGKRVVVVHPQTAILRQQPVSIAAPIAQLQPGVIAQVSECLAEWCLIDVKNYSGWIDKKQIWGVSSDEKITH